MQEELINHIAKCSGCGKCIAVCPIYHVTKQEASVARGRNKVLGYALAGKIPFDQELSEIMYECLLCGRCEEHCSVSVPTPEIIRLARKSYARKQAPLLQKFVFKHFLPHKGRLKLTNRMLRLYQDTGVRYLLKKTGLLSVLGPLGQAEDILPRITATFRDKEAALIPNPAEYRIKIGYFLGCGTNLLKAAQGVAAVNTLRQMGCRVDVPDASCCGLPALTYGQSDVTQDMAKSNLDLFLQSGYDYIVSDCASCSSMLTDYPHLFGETDPYHAKAAQLAARVLDYSQVVLKLGGDSKAVRQRTVTYHVPCHLARGLKAGQEPKTLLQNIEGLQYVELPEADVCCGAAGSYFVTHPELAKAVLRRKMENIRSTGADIVVSSCPMCLMQLEHGARLSNVPVEVKHLAELLAEGTVCCQQAAGDSK